MLQSQRKTWLSSRFSTFRYQVSLYFTFMNNPAEHRFDSFLGNIFPHPCYKEMFWPPWDQKQENLWWAGSGKEWMGMERRKKRNKQTRQHLCAGFKGTRLCTKTQGSGICFLGQPTWDTKPCSSTDIYPNCVHFSEQSSNPQYHIPLEDSSSFFFFSFWPIWRDVQNILRSKMKSTHLSSWQTKELGFSMVLCGSVWLYFCFTLSSAKA